MTYSDGAWCERAQKRNEKRVSEGYFTKNYYKRGKRTGKRIPNDIDFSLVVVSNRCQVCGKKGETIRYKVLIIHHKDGDINNNGLGNLMLVCRGCHNTIHKKGKPRRSEP